MSHSDLTLELSNAIRTMIEHIRSADDDDIAYKLQELEERAASGDGTVRVAFCGLFSAGKTSLLNALCLRDDLATGAVPTTALVTEVPLPGTSILCLDTPGVDSTDDAHQAATEAALHTADAVVLVMDYQQVESDTNLELAESFVHRGKPLYLVINQVDKHMDFELPFSEYQARVERTFSDWGIEQSGVLYTSTRRENDPGLLALRQSLTELAEHVDVQDSLVHAVVQLVQEHNEHQFAPMLHEAEDRLMKELGNVPYDRSEATEWRNERQDWIQIRRNQTEERFNSLLSDKQNLESNIARTIELAQVSPYETTELGRHYVESLRPGFKVGWIQSAAKTENERNSRLHKFVSDLGQRIEKFLVWPIQTTLREVLQGESWADLDWLSDVERLAADVTEEGCRSQVKSGALISEQYPYQYVKDVVQGIKSRFRGQVMSLLDEWFVRVRQNLETTLKYDAQVQQWQSEIEAVDAWLEVGTQMEESTLAMVRPLGVTELEEDKSGGQLV